MYLWFPAPPVYHASALRIQTSVLMLFQVSQPLWAPCFDKAAARYVQHQALKEKSVGSNCAMTINYDTTCMLKQESKLQVKSLIVHFHGDHATPSRLPNATIPIRESAKAVLTVDKQSQKFWCWKWTISCTEMFGYTCNNNLRKRNI